MKGVFYDAYTVNNELKKHIVCLERNQTRAERILHETQSTENNKCDMNHSFGWDFEEDGPLFGTSLDLNSW